jgi:hypothetical protein
MTDLERALVALAREVDWPPTPELSLRLAEAPAPTPRRSRRRAFVAAVALVLVALAVAFAVPPARSAILRFFHIGGVTVERVDTLPPAEERPLTADLGPVVAPEDAAFTLGTPFRWPEGTGRSQLHARGGAISGLLATPEPVLLSQFASDGLGGVKKLTAERTDVEWLEVEPGVLGVWITGEQHVLVWPEAPPRLAGNVLLWEDGGITFRLEGPSLTRRQALELARSILG